MTVYEAFRRMLRSLKGYRTFFKYKIRKKKGAEEKNCKKKYIYISKFCRSPAAGLRPFMRIDTVTEKCAIMIVILRPKKFLRNKNTESFVGKLPLSLQVREF